MFYHLLADLTVLLHLLFIVFVVIGGFAGLRYHRLVVLHLPAAAWGVYIEFSGDYCPLTPLENHFRRLAGEQGYTTGFIDHYLLPIIYPPALTSTVQFILGALVLVINLLAYSLLLRQYRRQTTG